MGKKEDLDQRIRQAQSQQITGKTEDQRQSRVARNLKRLARLKARRASLEAK